MAHPISRIHSWSLAAALCMLGAGCSSDGANLPREDGGAGAGATGGGSSGQGGSGGGGSGGSGGSGGGAGTASGGAGGIGGGTGGVAGLPDGGVGGDAGGGCDSEGAPCCHPSSGDGPNYCNNGLSCDGNTCVDCSCLRGAYFPVCGVDGMTYDATCGRACVAQPIACDGECPCACVAQLSPGCASTAPDGGMPCCEGSVCCEGIPYNPAGECQTECTLESDRNIKTDIHAADTQGLLESVARLPIHTWRYRATPEASHVGPMAQDFAAELGLGADDRVIATVDASGVALAAIQALNARIEQLSSLNAALVQRVERLEATRADCPPRTK